ncbi:MAG TPA: hypothetical protein VGO58_14305 [Chitinophagaceae bacterium]|jgi:hypothetical protein|nr:hypothetical protein [Chitinophagaceae bacterium]
MKKTVCLLGLVFFLSAFSGAQNLATVDTGKYRINLPDYWKPGNKIWEILTDKLPMVCEELVNKELCGDRCNPRYSIEFEMSEPEILDYYSNHISSGRNTQAWEFVTLYRYSSALLLLNEKDELLTKLILVDKNEIWRVTNKAELPSYMPAAPQRIYPVSSPTMNPQNQLNEGIRQSQLQTGTTGQSPFAYINKNKDKLSPTRRDMLGIIDEKIRSW